METSSLLEKYLRGGIAAAAGTKFTVGRDTNAIITAAVSPYSSDGEDGPYFDLEFMTLPEDDNIDEKEQTKAQVDDSNSRKAESGDENGHGSSNVEDPDYEREAKLKSSVSSDECSEENATTSPEELLFNGELVPIESSSVLLHDSDQNCKFPVSLLKSAAKFGVVLLKLTKSKPEQKENMSKREENQGETGRKFSAFRFEEVKVPFSSLFSRENDSKEKKQGEEMKRNVEINSEPNGVQVDRKSKQHHHLPLYVRISKGYVGRLRFYGQLKISEAEAGGGIPPPDIVAAEKGKDGTVKDGHVKTSPKHWKQMGILAGKSRPGSASVAAVPAAKLACNRRDDSLLQAQDGIQGAILHCKRSFHASSID